MGDLKKGPGSQLSTIVFHTLISRRAYTFSFTPLSMDRIGFWVTTRLIVLETFGATISRLIHGLEKTLASFGQISMAPRRENGFKYHALLRVFSLVLSSLSSTIRNPKRLKKNIIHTWPYLLFSTPPTHILTLRYMKHNTQNNIPFLRLDCLWAWRAWVRRR